MKVGTFTKQPAERISNSIVYTDALDEGDELTSIESCTATPEDLEVSPVLVSTDRVRIWSQGGTDGTVYRISLTVRTAGGEILQDELMCKVREI